MPTLVHFDIGADDLERAKRFYESLFGWTIRPMPGFPGYYEIGTTDLKGQQGLGGGLTKREGSQQPGVTNFIGVASIDEAISKLRRLGGKLVQDKQAVPGYGFLAVCADTEGNIFGLFEESPGAGELVEETEDGFQTGLS
jgi:predicted enzyme related to lactoylglutathione lyase